MLPIILTYLTRNSPALGTHKRVLSCILQNFLLSSVNGSQLILLILKCDDDSNDKADDIYFIQAVTQIIKDKGM